MENAMLRNLPLWAIFLSIPFALFAPIVVAWLLGYATHTTTINYLGAAAASIVLVAMICAIIAKELWHRHD